MLRHLGLVAGHRHGRRIIQALHDDHVADLPHQVVSRVEPVRLGVGGRRAAVGAIAS